jgi:hypothetical protein
MDFIHATVVIPSVLVTLGLAMSMACAGSVGKPPEALLRPESFTADLAGWQQMGAAEFSADPDVRHEGLVSARIRIPAGSALSYQQLRRDFTGDIRQGDEFTAVVWVRSEGVDQDPGAYLALEFVAADGSRAGISHSRSARDNGANEWQRLEASGPVPPGASSVRMSLILHAHGTAWFAGPSLTRVSRLEPWPDLGDRVRHVSVNPSKVVQAHFGGVGFHVFHHIFAASDDDLNEVIYKRWREMNPSFARMNDMWDYDRAMMERIAGHMAQLKATGTEIYLTTWNPPDVKDDKELDAWARRVADNLEFYVRTKGLTNLRTYCMTNELSLGRWGNLVGDLPRFKKYHRALYDELKRRKLGVGLLATDASPVDYWHTITWAAQNMDDITAVYGGHEYFNNHPPDDERFYPWWLRKLEEVVAVARSRSKNFILGEFGARQDGRTVNGIQQDRCVYFETPQEPLVTIQLAEAVIAAINAGVYGMGYWTYMDFPDEYSPNYINKWGTFRCSGADRSTRAIYYGYALLTRYFRGPSQAYAVSTDDPRVRAAAVQRWDSRAWSIAVVNRNGRDVALRIGMPSAGTGKLRKYVYDPSNVKHHPYGDLPGPVAVVTVKQGRLEDRVLPGTLTVYTSAYDDTPPPAVTGMRVEQTTEGNRITWQKSTATDICYYRVYRIANGVKQQIRSTITTTVLDKGAPASARYAVTAVDTSGNESK